MASRMKGKKRASKVSKPAKLARRPKAKAAKPRKAQAAAKPSKAARVPAPRPKAAPAQDLARDRAEILAVSKMWWDANRKFSIPMMVEAFVGADKFHGFNLNGHTYYTISEWVRLWEYLGHVMTPSVDGAPAMGEPHDVRLEIRGDMAFLTAEAMFSAKIAATSDAQSASLPGPGETLKMPFRTTEVFVREDHEGRPIWKMWHFHASPRAPEGEPRMGGF